MLEFVEQFVLDGSLGSILITGHAAQSGIVSALLAVGAATPVAWSGLILLWAAVPFLALPLAEPLRGLLRFALPVCALSLTVGCSIGRAAESSIRQSRAEPSM